MKEKLGQLYRKYHEIIAYLFWGFLTAVVSWGTYIIFTKILTFGKFTVTVANILSWVFAVLFAFISNKIRVFESRDWSFKTTFPELWKFVGTRAATGLYEIVTVPALVALGLDQRIFGIEGMLSKVIISLSVVIINYIASKFLVFKHHD